jgi:hypothetical protein
MSLPSVPAGRRDSLSNELEVMAAVGRALDSLDPAARQRVIRWASERLGAEPLQIPEKVKGTPNNFDVEGLHDLFDDPRPREGLELVTPRKAEPPASVVEFQRYSDDSHRD